MPINTNQMPKTPIGCPKRKIIKVKALIRIIVDIFRAKTNLSYDRNSKKNHLVIGSYGQIVRKPFFTSKCATAARTEQPPPGRWPPNFAQVILVAVLG